MAEFYVHSFSATISFCRSCQARIRFAFTERFARMPLNENFQVVRREQRADKNGVVREMSVVSAADSHFATCPQAARFRKGKAA